MLTWVVVCLAAFMSVVAFSFAYGVIRHSGVKPLWDWPPDWMRVVAHWLVAKAEFFFIGVTFCWAMGYVGFQPKANHWWEKAIYIIPLAHLTLAHAITFVYWMTGRATGEDVTFADDLPSEEVGT